MEQKSNEIENCKCTVIHNEIIDRVKQTFISENESYDLAELFKVFGDKTRIKIIYALSKSEMCVCDISALLSMTQSAISHQLKVLRQSKLVKARKDGKVVYYSLDDDHINEILNLGLVHINEE